MATAACPKCGRVGRTSRPAPAGAKLKCPGCGERFAPGAEPLFAAPPTVRESPARVPVRFTLPALPALPTLPKLWPRHPAPRVLDVAPPPVLVPVPARVACPFCGEDIAAAAKKCKHCGEFLDPKLREHERARAAPAPAPPTIAVNVHNSAAAVAGGYPVKRWSRGVAVLLSLFIPGAGQLYKGQPLNGVVWFLLTVAGYAAFVVPGVVLHLCCVIGAATGDPYR